MSTNLYRTDLGCLLVSLVAATGLLASCSSSEVTDSVLDGLTSNCPIAYTVNYPLQYFAERIGGDAIDVEFPTPPDIDPAVWMPDTEEIAQYQQADVIFLNGAGYSQWLKAVSLPASKTIYTSVPFQDRYILQEDCGTHSHGLEGDHSHCDFAFTTWLDPQLAI